MAHKTGPDSKTTEQVNIKEYMVRFLKIAEIEQIYQKTLNT